MEEMLIGKMGCINNDPVVEDLEATQRSVQSDKLIGRQVKIELKPNDVYRVPLMWLMRDSTVDLAIMRQVQGRDDDEQDPVELFTDIQSLFNQSADDE